MISKFVKLISTFDSDSLKELPNIYSSTIEYEDPINKVQGLDTCIWCLKTLLRFFLE